MKALFGEGGKKTKYLIPLALFLLGIILIVAGMLLGNRGNSRGAFAALSGRSQEAELEEKIRSLCEQVDGVSEVTVVVSLSDTASDATAGNIAGVGIVCRGAEMKKSVQRITVGCIRNHRATVRRSVLADQEVGASHT